MKEVYINIKDLGDCYLKRYLDEKFKKDLISIDDLLTLTEDVIYDLENLKDEHRELQQDLEENYRPIPVNEQYEVYDRDFI